MSNTQIAVVVPSNISLPARFAGTDIAAQIAADNAAAAGGIRAGGFPSISIKGSKFHIKDEGKLETLMNPPAAPGQPSLPMGLLEVVVVGANSGLSKSYYPGDYEDGANDAPTCSSSNGIVPDAHIAAPQNDLCATCRRNQWGSKVSKMSGKDVKECTDFKQLVVLPAGDLNYKALGLSITPSALTDWGKFVQVLSGRSIPFKEIVVNLTFDHTASFPKLQFAFNRFLTDDESARVKERALGDDVKAIISPRSMAPAAPALAAPVQPAALAAVTPASVAVPAPTPPVVPAATAPVFGFGAPAQTPTPPVQAPTTAAEPPKRTRRTRAQIEADKVVAGVDLSLLPPAVQQAVKALGADSEAGKALLAQFATAAAPAPAPTFVPTPGMTVGFGASVPAQQAPSAAVISSAASLKAQLEAKLNAAKGA